MKSRMTIVTFKAPRDLMAELDDLVKSGIFGSRSEAIRYALGMLISSRYIKEKVSG